MRGVVVLFILMMGLFTGRAESKNGHGKLLKEFLENNTSVVTARSRKKLAALSYQMLGASKTFFFAFEKAKVTDRSDNLTYGSKAYNSTSNSHSWTLSKDFLFGTTLSYKKSKTDYYLDSAKKSRYEYGTTLTISQNLGQDFFGISHRKALESASYHAKGVQALSKDQVERLLIHFYSTFVSIRIQKTMVSLSNETLKRAKRRTSLIRKRVRDGIRRKVDLYQAQMLEMKSLEDLKNAKMVLDDSLAQMSDLLGRKVLGKEVDDLAFRRLPSLRTASRANSYELLAKKMELEKAKRDLDKSMYAMLPVIKLTGSYRYNDWDYDKAMARGKGGYGENQKKTTVAITASWPLLLAPQRVDLQMKKVSKMVAQRQLHAMENKFDNISESLLRQINLLEKNIGLSKKRQVLARKAVSEYNRLYKIGKAALDNVIQAEEDLSSSAKIYFGNLQKRELMRASFEQLNGNLKNYLIQ